MGALTVPSVAAGAPRRTRWAGVGALVATELRRCARRTLLRGLPVVALAAVGTVVGAAMAAGATYDGAEAATTLRALLRLLVPVGAAVGAGIQGSWFTSGTVVNVLVGEPRRLRVAAAQALAVSATTALSVTLAAAVVLAGLVAWAAWSELVVPADVLVASGAELGRVAVAVAAAAWLGAAVATLARSSAVAVTVVLVGALVLEPTVVQLVGSVAREDPSAALPLAGLVLAAGPPPEAASIASAVPWPAGVGAALWVVAATALAAWVHARRDLA